MTRTTDWESRIRRRVTLRDLHVLSSVVRWGSMAKAASHLAMSQSAVSESIAHLEDAIRVRLLDRTPHGIEPTIYAETLLKRGDVIFCRPRSTNYHVDIRKSLFVFFNRIP